MTSPSKESPTTGTAADLTSSADYFTKTQALLLAAKNGRDMAALRRAAIRIDGDRFLLLPEPAQEDLLELYGAAMMACGGLQP